MTTEDSGQSGCRAPAGGVLGCHLSGDPALKEEGWEWRVNAEGAKLRQVVDSYRELGFEVRLEPIDLSGLSEACWGCRGVLSQSTAVFVRTRR